MSLGSGMMGVSLSWYVNMGHELSVVRAFSQSSMATYTSANLAHVPNSLGAATVLRSAQPKAMRNLASFSSGVAAVWAFLRRNSACVSSIT
jgi:hypothetical protein